MQELVLWWRADWYFCGTGKWTDSCWQGYIQREDVIVDICPELKTQCTASAASQPRSCGKKNHLQFELWLRSWKTSKKPLNRALLCREDWPLIRSGCISAILQIQPLQGKRWHHDTSEHLLPLVSLRVCGFVCVRDLDLGRSRMSLNHCILPVVGGRWCASGKKVTQLTYIWLTHDLWSSLSHHSSKCRIGLLSSLNLISADVSIGTCRHKQYRHIVIVMD